jgi:acyl-CoA dehydrogenase
MTADEDALVAELVRDILAQHPPATLSPRRLWDPDLWAELSQAGLTTIGMDEADDAGPAQAVPVAALLAAGAAAVPFVEQVLVAGPAMQAAGLSLPPLDAPLTFAFHGITAERAANAYVLSGNAIDIPWLSVAGYVVVAAESAAGPVLAVLPTPGLDIESAANVAGEPRDRLRLEALRAPAAAISAQQAADFASRYALARAAQLSGALQEILRLTLRYAADRRQFGRSIGSFQATQFALAEMAGEVAAVDSLVRAATDALSEGGRSAGPLISAAKIAAGEAVRIVARHAHQIHGAIGFTQEYSLHHLTRRCWAWRDEAGSELAHARSLGETMRRSHCGDLWDRLVELL